MSSTTVAHSEWLREVCERQPEAARLLNAPEQEQQRLGYFHTLKEILQQPPSWIQTAEQVTALAPDLRSCVAGIRNLVLTGSGSSEYAGHCVRLALQQQLGINTLAIGGGVLLTHSSKALPPGRPSLLVSIARSGDSPESVGALSLLMENEPELRHLVLTCNAKGKLATSFQNDSRVHVVALADGTNDRSLVMTSSFTNLVIAAQFLGFLDASNRYLSRARKLGAIASELLPAHFGTLARTASLDFRRVVFLGSGSRFGAAREAALKTDTLVVCLLSSDPTSRAYEADLVRELDQKNLGMLKLVVGDDIPADLVRDHDVAIDCPGLSEVGDDAAPVIDVVVGQLLGFFRCLREGLLPDSPSEGGVINRVVQSFTLHFPAGRTRQSDLSGDGE